MSRDIVRIDRAAPTDFGQQAVEQRDIATDRQRQVEVGLRAGRRAARIDDDQLQLRSRGTGSGDTLVENRVTPCQIGSDQHYKICLFQILVDARHGVRPESAFMSRDGGRHAQPGIGVDIGAADARPTVSPSADPLEHRRPRLFG